VGDERLVCVGGVELAVQSFGVPADPPVLLIAGAGASMNWWDEDFCRRLAAGSRYVIRYDHRDTGRSVTSPPGAPDNTQDDLLADAVEVLDAFGSSSAHVVGVSMGGDLAQRMAVRHPDRVASLTLIATSPGGPSDPDLPPMAEHLRRPLALPDPAEPGAVITHLVETMRRFVGELPFDEDRVRRTAERVVGRSVDVAASTNHMLAERLAQVVAPTLVVHGTADPLFPFGHAEALAAEIPGARLLPVLGMGHEVPPPEVWDLVVPAILEHTAGDWEAQADRLASRSLAAGDATGWFDQLYPAGRAGAVQKSRPAARWSSSRPRGTRRARPRKARRGHSPARRSRRSRWDVSPPCASSTSPTRAIPPAGVGLRSSEGRDERRAPSGTPGSIALPWAEPGRGVAVTR
jgi:pimeloyl-ACP methyl ester carboxylesterase